MDRYWIGAWSLGLARWVKFQICDWLSVTDPTFSLVDTYYNFQHLIGNRVQSVEVSCSTINYIFIILWRFCYTCSQNFITKIKKKNEKNCLINILSDYSGELEDDVGVKWFVLRILDVEVTFLSTIDNVTCYIVLDLTRSYQIGSMDLLKKRK